VAETVCSSIEISARHRVAHRYRNNISRHRRLVSLTFGMLLLPAAGPGLARAASNTDVPSKKTPEAIEDAGARLFPAVERTLSPGDSGRIDPRVLRLAVDSTSCALSRGVMARRPGTLTLIDYSRPSTEPRLWVIDLETGNVLFEELVAHGAGSGGNLATQFSNDPDSHQSSLGLFATEGTYVGKHGYSLRLNGLESGVNDRARERAIVMHGADYVNADIAASLGRLGRSWGCPALRPAIVRRVIDRIKDGNVVFAYYPDQAWLASSPFLTSCAATPSQA
jgi:hypothetical protein